MPDCAVRPVHPYDALVKSSIFNSSASLEKRSYTRSVNMKRVLTVSSCLLLLAAACIPAYASPTNKKVTISCDTTGTDVFTGETTVALCPLSPSVVDCNTSTAGAVVCGTPVTAPIDCSIGMSAPISQTVPCSAGFKVEAVFIDLGIQGFTSTQHTIAVTGGKAISTSDTVGTATVSVTVK
jgi:hypothetical protein